MNFNKYIFPSLALCMASGLLLTGCRDDDLYADRHDVEKYTGESALIFDLNLTPFNDGNSGSYSKESEHGEGWENYIHPEMIRVIFCDNEGNYIYEANRHNIFLISKESLGQDNADAYRLIIPRKELMHDGCGDPEKEKRHNEAIRKAVYEDGFKVAVLANWPFFVEGHRYKDPHTGDEYLGSATESTDLDFEWFDDAANGVLGDEERPRNTKIGYLSQCIYDNVYGEPIEEGTEIYSESYEHLVYKQGKGKGQMGVFTPWVAYIYPTHEKAAEFIRAGEDNDGDDIEGDVHFTYSYGFKGNGAREPNNFYYTPYSYTRTVDRLNFYDLDNIMRLWNFSAGATCRYHEGMGTNARDYWQARNQYTLVERLRQISWGAGSAFDIKDNEDNEVLDCTNAATTYEPVSGTSGGYLKMPNGVSVADVDNLSQGINSNNRATADKFKNSAIHFKAYGEGVLRIRAKAPGSGQVSVLTQVAGEGAMYMIHTFEDYKETDSFLFKPGEAKTTRDGYPECEFLIDPSSEQYLDVYIASVGGTIQFYEIEYIRSRHIYDSARNAIMPSKTNPIPMYGIQNFDPIGDYIDYIPSNECFNMSDESYNYYLENSGLKRYNYKDVYLLRSVAKVELRFRKSVFGKNPPEHVMMRVMNRTARCEPKDVVNPTDWIWFGANGYMEGGSQMGPANKIDTEASPAKFAGADEEFKNIMKYYSEYPLYDAGISDVGVYHDRTAWFYGYWADTDAALDSRIRNKYYWQVPWNWNGLGINIPSTIPYPRIFNTRIDRSDYCRFHQVPDDNEYIRYVMYVPEKNITDTDLKGRLNATPKVQHIELRFKNMNTALNFDDDDCYRIYFTDYDENGESMKSVVRKGGYTAFEKNPDILNTLQPIMRNCHYIFTVNSINENQLGVSYTVCGAATRNGRPIVIN